MGFNGHNGSLENDRFHKKGSAVGNWKRIYLGGRDQGRPVLAFEVSLQGRAGFGSGCGQKGEQDIGSQAMRESWGHLCV